MLRCLALPALLIGTALPASAQSTLLTGATVLTEAGAEPQPMDILVEDGRIAAMGEGLSADGAEQVDLAGTVILPGFVDTHWHMWNTLARGREHTGTGGFSEAMAPLAAAWTPEASALSVKIAMAEAVNSGITWVNNWADNIQGPDNARAELAAMRDSGVKGRFSYGWSQAAGEGDVMDLADLRQLAEGWEEGPIGLGVALRGPDRSIMTVWEEELEAARDLGLPITFHMGGSASEAIKENINILDNYDQLGDDMLVVHMTQALPEAYATLARSGAALSISPWTELAAGYGVPNPAAMAGSGVRMGLSVDTTVLAGQANMFDVMRLTADLADGANEMQQSVIDTTVLDWATKGGARALGIEAGVLEEGAAADLIAVRTDGLTTSTAANIPFLLTHSAEPSDVDFVMIDGTIHKRDGALTRVDLPALLQEADAMMTGIETQAVN